MVRFSLFLFIVCTFPSCNDKRVVNVSGQTTTKFEKDIVPDSSTAIKIAEAIWVPIYGKKIYSERPFRASLKDSIWVVEGTFPKGYEGGTAYIEIQKKDGKILMVTHYK